MVRLTVAGPDTVLASTSCAACPYSPAGCCVAPPRYDWSDIARVVRHGGRDWLLARIAEGALVRIEHGLSVRRVKGRVLPTREAPRLAKCVFHDGRSGCTIDERQRPATCNFYLCDHALDEARRAGREGRAEADRAAAIHDALVNDFVAWDAQLAAEVRAWPEEQRHTAAFLDWLANAWPAP